MKHESRPHGERPFTYHPQHVDVETFEKNYAAIDWSRKREKTPVENPEYAKATIQERIDVHPMVLAPHCYMCHHTKPALDWIELDEKPRVVCSTRCYHNYCKGSDLV